MKKLYILTLIALFAATSLPAQFSIKKVVIEEFTGAWCGYCPDGALIMDDILNTYPDAIGVALHDGDAMEFADGATVTSFYQQGFPSATIDRDGPGISRNQWKSTVATKLQGAGSVTMSFEDVNWNAATREITVTVKGSFTGPKSGDLRLNCFVTEDNVTGTGTGYNQTNYYNTTNGHYYNGAGNPIVGYNHRHVLRAMLGGSWGTSGVVPATVNFGSTASQTYTYTLPAAYDENEIHLVAVCSEYGSGTQSRDILNGETVPLMTPTALDEEMGAANWMEAYPNPTTDLTRIGFSLTSDEFVTVDVVNTLGQQVTTIFEGYQNSGAHSVVFDARNLENGMYLVRLSAGTQTLVKRVMVAK